MLAEKPVDKLREEIKEENEKLLHAKADELIEGSEFFESIIESNLLIK